MTTATRGLILTDLAPGGASLSGPAWTSPIALPDSLLRDREFGPVLVILSDPQIAHRAAPFVDIRQREVDFKGLLDVPWSSTQRLLIQAAAAFWSSSNECSFGQLVARLDARQWRRVEIATGVLYGRLDLVGALIQARAEG